MVPTSWTSLTYSTRRVSITSDAERATEGGWCPRALTNRPHESCSATLTPLLSQNRRARVTEHLGVRTEFTRAKLRAVRKQTRDLIGRSRSLHSHSQFLVRKLAEAMLHIASMYPPCPECCRKGTRLEIASVEKPEADFRCRRCEHAWSHNDCQRLTQTGT